MLPCILQWSSTHEASVAVFLLQRLTLHEYGVHTLITPHKRLHKPPISLLGDFLQQNISTESLNLPADTLAGILYLFTKAIDSINGTTTNDLQRQWKVILDTVVDAEDSFVRLWAVLALAACPLNSVKEEKVVQELALTDQSETIRTAAAYSIWCWQGSVFASHNQPNTNMEWQLVTFISRIAEDASFNVRTLALSLALELAYFHRDGFLDHVKEHSKECTDREDWTSPLALAYHNLVLILVNALTDPLLFLREAVSSSLERLRLQQTICNHEQWIQVFPYDFANSKQTSRNSSERSTSDVLASEKVSSCIGQGRLSKDCTMTPSEIRR